MPQCNFSTHDDPLEILRRFTPTPLKAMYRIGPDRVMVQTNDFALLPALPLEANLGGPGEQTLDWKLIRDPDLLTPLEVPMYLNLRALTVVEMGAACLLGLDHERRELLGFIGAAIDARTYQEFLVPFFCRMTKQALSLDNSFYSYSHDEEFANE